MGTYNYGPLQETAVRLVDKYGIDFTAERDGANYKSSCVFGDVDIDQLPNTLQQTVDAVIFVKVTKKYIPQNGDYIKAQNKTYVVIDHITYQPGDTPMLYEVFLSK